MNCNDEVVIKLVGKLSLLYPDLSQLKIRNVVDEVLIDYDIQPKEKNLVASDIEEKIRYFLATKKLDGASKLTLYGYKLHLLRFANCFHKPINSITVVDIRVYLAALSRKVKNTTIATEISILKSFFGWLENEEMIIKNPMRKIKSIKKEKRLRKALTQEELELLRDACKTDRERAILEFLFSTGCRLSELVNVNIDDIDRNTNSLKVIGKGNKERVVYLNAKAKLYLEKYLKSREKLDKLSNPALFICSKHPYRRLGNRSVEKEINNIAARSGIKKSIFPHLLRHTMATLGLKSGMSLTTVQKILGHTDPGTTEIYAEIDDETVQTEFKKYLIQ